MKKQKYFAASIVTIFIATATFAATDGWIKKFDNHYAICFQLLKDSLKCDEKNRTDKIEQAFRHAKKLQTLAETNSFPNTAQTALAAKALGRVYFFKHDIGMSVDNYERYLIIVRKGLRNKGVTLAEAIEEVARVYNAAGLTERAERLIDEANRLRAGAK